MFDFIIIGGGSAGCVLADKLSENGKYNVCLLEAGKKDNNWAIHLPLGVVALMQNKALNWCFNTHPEPTLNNREIYTPRGKLLGGSSSINAMLYVRGQKQDYDHWCALGNEGWAYQDILPYFKSLEHQERGEDDYHGINGPLNVADSVSKPPINDDFINSAIAAGYPKNDDFNGSSQEGIGYFQVTQKDGLRHSAAKAFLTPNLERSNLTILTEIQVENIIIENNIATGVVYKKDGITCQLHAAKEIILSAGAIHSPQILMLSGIGPKQELEKHNIPIKHELPGVGQNLQDHVDVLSVVQQKNTDVLSYRPKGLWWMIKSALKFPMNKSGILTSVVAETGGFIKSEPELKEPDLQLHFVPAAMDDHGRNHKLMCTYGVALHVCLLRPKSRGSVTLTSNKVSHAPHINLNMLDHPDDIDKMIKGVRIAQKILSTPPLSDNHIKFIFPAENCKSDKQIHHFLKEKCNTIYHPVGTCKMGKDKAAVVDDKLRVHGINNLRVVDASIMPTLISGNTNAPTMMIAAKAAENILSKYEARTESMNDNIK